MSKQPLEFQMDSANHIAGQFRSGSRRFLLADEVGLGKTVVAAQVINMLAADTPDRPFVVYYICNNERVTAQNKKSLSERTRAVNTEDLRLSMQWGYASRYLNAIGRDGRSNVIIIPLSPATTFTNKGSDFGTQRERTQMTDYLYDHHPRAAAEELEKRLGKDREVFRQLRAFFNDLSLKLLPPGMVIMDEFQNYPSLYRKDSTASYSLSNVIEQQGTRVLLLSATPYRMTTDDYDRLQRESKSLEPENGAEDEDDCEQASPAYQDFDELMRFIINDEAQYNYYRSHRTDSELLMRYLCRTERAMFYGDSSDYDTQQNIRNVEVDSDLTHAAAYLRYNCDLHNAYADRDIGELVLWSKRAPNYLSFSTRYLSMRPGSNKNESHFINHTVRDDLLRSQSVDPFGQYSMGILRQQTMPAGVEQLLWIPPLFANSPAGLHYDFESGNPFFALRDYTKTLTFAGYRMSTAAVSGLLSSECRVRVAAMTAAPTQCVDSAGASGSFAAVTNFPPEHSRLLLAEYDKLMTALSGFDQSLYLLVDHKVMDANLPLIRTVTGIEDAAVAKAKYAVMGSLGSVVEEYLFLNGYTLLDKPSAEFARLLRCMCDYSGSTVRMANGDEPLAESKRDGRTMTAYPAGQTVTCVFAERFTDDKSDSGDHNHQHEEALRGLFNSPFHPFVLAATSTAQEGLDFHCYSHCIAHYSLPLGPVKYEQREGRVDRFRSHLMRKRLRQLFDGQAGTVADLYELAQRRNREQPGWQQKILFPDWNVDLDDFNRFGVPLPDELCCLRRIVCALPLSSESRYFARLEGMARSYRKPFGPEGSPGDKPINLSPYYHRLQDKKP